MAIVLARGGIVLSKTYHDSFWTAVPPHNHLLIPPPGVPARIRFGIRSMPRTPPTRPSRMGGIVLIRFSVRGYRFKQNILGIVLGKFLVQPENSAIRKRRSAVGAIWEGSGGKRFPRAFVLGFVLLAYWWRLFHAALHGRH